MPCGFFKQGYGSRGFEIVEHRPKSNDGDQVFGGIVSVSMECASGLTMTEPGVCKPDNTLNASNPRSIPIFSMCLVLASTAHENVSGGNG